MTNTQIVLTQNENYNLLYIALLIDILLNHFYLFLNLLKHVTGLRLTDLQEDT